MHVCQHRLRYNLTISNRYFTPSPLKKARVKGAPATLTVVVHYSFPKQRGCLVCTTFMLCIITNIIHILYNHNSATMQHAPKTKWDCTHIMDWKNSYACFQHGHHGLCFGNSQDAFSIATESSHLTREHVESVRKDNPRLLLYILRCH